MKRLLSILVIIVFTSILKSCGDSEIIEQQQKKIVELTHQLKR